MRRLLLVLLLPLLLFPPSLFAQQRRQPKKPIAATTKQPTPEPTLSEVLKTLKGHLLLTGHSKTDKSLYEVSLVDFDDCKFLFEIKFRYTSYDGKIGAGTSRYTSNFRYLADQVEVVKEGLGRPTLLTVKTKDNSKLVLFERTSLLGASRRNTTETETFLQLTFDEKEDAEKAALLIRQAIKLCQAR